MASANAHQKNLRLVKTTTTQATPPKNKLAATPAGNKPKDNSPTSGRIPWRGAPAIVPIMYHRRITMQRTPQERVPVKREDTRVSRRHEREPESMYNYAKISQDVRDYNFFLSYPFKKKILGGDTRGKGEMI